MTRLQAVHATRLHLQSNIELKTNQFIKSVELAKGSKSTQDEAVLVVGSGVAGLSTAVEAVANGYDDVSIVEKRGAGRTRRKFWWDLIPSTVRRLKSYGFQDLSIPFHTEVEGILAV